MSDSMMASFLVSAFLYIRTNYLQWKHKSNANTVVGCVVDSPDINLFPILQNRLEEEDGPTAFDDLEAHAGDRGTLFPEATLPVSDQPHLPNQKYSNRKRSKRRMNDFEESGR